MVRCHTYGHLLEVEISQNEYVNFQFIQRGKPKCNYEVWTTREQAAFHPAARL